MHRRRSLNCAVCACAVCAWRRKALVPRGEGSPEIRLLPLEYRCPMRHALDAKVSRAKTDAVRMRLGCQTDWHRRAVPAVTCASARSPSSRRCSPAGHRQRRRSLHSSRAALSAAGQARESGPRCTRQRAAAAAATATRWVPQPTHPAITSASATRDALRPGIAVATYALHAVSPAIATRAITVQVSQPRRRPRHRPRRRPRRQPRRQPRRRPRRRPR